MNGASVDTEELEELEAARLAREKRAAARENASFELMGGTRSIPGRVARKVDAMIDRLQSVEQVQDPAEGPTGYLRDKS